MAIKVVNSPEAVMAALEQMHPAVPRKAEPKTGPVVRYDREERKALIVSRGRSDGKKLRISICIDRDVVETLKSGGRFWQTRANDILRKALGL